MIKHLSDTSRTIAYGQEYSPTWVDQFGVWLSWRKILKSLPKNGIKPRWGDFGSGYHAALTRRAISHISSAIIIDLNTADDLKEHSKINVIEGSLPTALEGLESESLDIIVCNSVIEHLWKPEETLAHFYRLLAPGGCCFINVPSWRGKWFLEFFSFRLSLSPVAEMNDHKTYYDPRDLWPMLVKVGFLPFYIQCRRHKFGLNTFARCRKPGAIDD